MLLPRLSEAVPCTQSVCKHLYQARLDAQSNWAVKLPAGSAAQGDDQAPGCRSVDSILAGSHGRVALCHRALATAQSTVRQSTAMPSGAHVTIIKVAQLALLLAAWRRTQHQTSPLEGTVKKVTSLRATAALCHRSARLPEDCVAVNCLMTVRKSTCAAAGSNLKG